MDDLIERLEKAEAEVERLRALIGRPYVGAWKDAVVIEAAHQRERWGGDHDARKEPADWFWTLGYLAGKALAAHARGDLDKAAHHTVSSGAVLAHWAEAIEAAIQRAKP